MNHRMLLIAAGLLSAGPAFATTHCVATADELTAALLAAEQNTAAATRSGFAPVTTRRPMAAGTWMCNCAES